MWQELWVNARHTDIYSYKIMCTRTSNELAQRELNLTWQYLWHAIKTLSTDQCALFDVQCDTYKVVEKKKLTTTTTPPNCRLSILSRKT